MALERLDTVDTATTMLSDPGMPFNEKELRASITRVIDGDAFSHGERALLKFALENMEKDKYSDRSSVSGYETFLSIAQRGSVIDDDYFSFRLLPDKTTLDLCTKVRDKKTVETLKDNLALFEQIEVAFSRDEIREKLGGTFKKSFINDLEKKKVSDEPWFSGLTYGLVKDSKRSDDKIVDLSDEPIEVHYRTEPESLNIPTDDFLVRPEGESAAAKRRKHIIVFVPNDASEALLKFKTTSPVRKDHLKDNKDLDPDEDIHYTQSTITFSLKCPEDANFIKASVQRNTLNIAILKVRPKFLKGIETRYFIERKKKKSSILVEVENGTFVINPTGTEEICEQVENDKTLTCFDLQKLVISTDEAEMDSSENNISFTVVCDGSHIPFSVKLDIARKKKIDGVGIYREKTLAQKSFGRLERDRLQLGTSEYSIEEQEALNRLAIEDKMINKHWFAAQSNGSELEGKTLTLPTRLTRAYENLFDQLKNMGTTMSLAYVGDKQIKDTVIECVEAYAECLEEIRPGDHGYEDLLEVGVVFASGNAGNILLSPFHPVNLAYQLNLLSLGQFDKDDSLTNIALAKLVHHQAIPYIYYKDTYYEAADITSMPEWVVYYEFESERARALGAVVSKIVRERIDDFLNHFGFLFKSGKKKPLRIACYNLGSCEGIFIGIAEFLFKKYIDCDENADDVIPIHVDCYGDPNTYTAFENLLNRDTLVQFLNEKSLLPIKQKDVSDSECISLLLSHLSFSLHGSTDKREYAHLAFIPGPSEQAPQVMGEYPTLNTGVMLNGATISAATTDSGSTGGGWFNSGFGTKDISSNDFTDMLTKMNVLHATAYTSGGVGDKVIQVSVSKVSEESYNTVYDSANWVVLLDPKVDPMHFAKANDSDRPLVIHYEDREASTGYDAITVTKKTSQYESAIAEAFNDASSGDISEHVKDVVSFANAFNGTWLLSFLESKNPQTPRSRMSMLAAVKAALHHYRSEDILWVPLSLEEILRLSNGLKLSAATEINSWKNLGFERAPMSDDVLLVGITGEKENPRVLLHPIEVKVGNCTETELQKGVYQAEQTYEKFMAKYWGDITRELLSTKVARNAFMQKVLMSAEKMDAYGVLKEIDWQKILNEYRTALQNEDYELVKSESLNMPTGTVCAFAAGKAQTEVETRGNTRILLIPETKIPDITVGSLETADEIIGRYDFDIPFTPGNPVDYQEGSESDDEDEPILAGTSSEPAIEEPYTPDDGFVDFSQPGEPSGIVVEFGRNLENGERVLWEPCNTDKLFHTNTGIIGTMGTGKTQFTKSLVTQLYLNRSENPVSGEIGILIFDYKGDYNNSQAEFIEATNATVYRPYKLPFNPLSIIKSENSLPLLPKHIANTFKDTLVKACASSKMGAIQENILRRVIMEAYELKQIDPGDPATWNREPPTFETVYRIYQNDDDIKKNDTLASMMEKLHEFEIFESDPKKTQSLFEALNGVVVIDLSGYDQDIQNLVVGIMTDLFYSQMHAAGHSAITGNLRELTKFILVDEADNFISQGFPSLKKILKEGREFGVGVILSTQFLTHFRSKEEDYSKYVLTWVVHNVSDLDPSDIRFVFNTTAKSAEEEYYYNEVKRMPKHCSLAKMGETSKPIPMRDLAFFELMEGES